MFSKKYRWGGSADALNLELIWTNPHTVTGTSYDTYDYDTGQKTSGSGTRCFHAGVIDVNTYSRFFVAVKQADVTDTTLFEVFPYTATSKSAQQYIMTSKYAIGYNLVQWRWCRFNSNLGYNLIFDNVGVGTRDFDGEMSDRRYAFPIAVYGVR